MTTVLAGLPAAPGIGIGTLVVYRPGQIALDLDADPAADPHGEWRIFLTAHAQVDAELEQLGQNANSLIAEIFAAHRIILHDHTLLDAVRAAIFDQQSSAAAATQKVIGELTGLFRSFEDDYFAGRAMDILDLGQRLLAHLGASLDRPQLEHLSAPTILIAEDLTPTDLALLPVDRVQGIALAASTPTAHSAILARALGIPLVCSLGQGLLLQQSGRTAIVDGYQGKLLIDAGAAEVDSYADLRRIHLAEDAEALAHAHDPAYTLDGIRIPVCVNANSPQEVAQSRAAGADGIGLLRTEYLFHGRNTPPTADEQAATYALFFTQVDHQLTVRALDAGGDKPVIFIAHRREDNPFLGMRGVRLLLEEPELLRTQYRALQLAAKHAPPGLDVRFMLPMISTLEEVLAVHAILAGGPDDLPRLKLGIMVEVPSAALIAHSLAPHVDFFSIGTNDLAQYVLAGDRTNTTIAKLVDPLHPAVLRLIRITCEAGQAHNKPVSICGEIGGNPAAVPLLLGLGITELSVPLPAAPLVKVKVRHSRVAECRDLAAAALACPGAAEVRALLVESV